MNPFLVNIILFSTDTWSEVDLQSLKELDRINNIQDFCIKAFDFKYGFQDWSYLSEGFYMAHLVRSLSCSVLDQVLALELARPQAWPIQPSFFSVKWHDDKIREQQQPPPPIGFCLTQSPFFKLL